MCWHHVNVDSPALIFSQISDGSGSEEETDSDGDLFGETKKRGEFSDEESDNEEVKQVNFFLQLCKVPHEFTFDV